MSPERVKQMIYEREMTLAKIYSKKYMLARWKKINYTPPKPKQLSIFDLD